MNKRYISDCCKASTSLNKPDAKRGETIWHICNNCNHACNLEVDTLIISGFPGIGKSYYTNISGLRSDCVFTVLDSDSSKFDKNDFPKNYIQHIKENIGKADIIFVSSHKTIRNALRNHGIEFFIAFPFPELKQEYIKRYIERGNSEDFIKLLHENWDNWIKECIDFPTSNKIELRSGEYIKDVLDKIN